MGNFYVPVRWNVPLCFPSAEVFGRWREMSRGRLAKIGSDGYCADCTPLYHDAMVAKGRCEHPEVIFTVDENGDPVGHRHDPGPKRKVVKLTLVTT